MKYVMPKKTTAPKKKTTKRKAPVVAEPVKHPAANRRNPLSSLMAVINKGASAISKLKKDK